MKWYIVAGAIIVLSVNLLLFNEDNNLHQQQLLRLKFVCQEAAAAGAQYIDENEYKDGKFVFKQTESKKAIEEIIKYNLKLDDNFIPLPNTYWQDKVNYTVTIFDDSNTDFTKPILYTDPYGTFTHVITSPTIVVSINAGKARYRTLNVNPDVYRVSAHSWKDS